MCYTYRQGKCGVAMVINLNFDTSKLVAWCAKQRSYLQQHIELLEAGKMTDTTGQSLGQGAESLAELTQLEQEMKPATFQTQVETVIKPPRSRV